MIACLYELGCRIGELLILRLKNLNLKEYDVNGEKKIVYSVDIDDGKTGMRNCMIISAVPYLKDWLKIHPRQESNAPLWCHEQEHMCGKYGKKARRGDPIKYRTASGVIKKLVRDAGITKKINTHRLGRHSRVTHLLKNKTFGQQHAVAFFGWSSADMIQNYAHVTGEDANNALLEANGIVETNNSVQQKRCIACNATLLEDAIVCPHCDQIPTLEAREKLESRDRLIIELADELLMDKVVRERMKKLAKKPNAQSLLKRIAKSL